MGIYYLVYITYWDHSVSKRIILGNCKKELYAYIGYMYSNSEEKIERIDYEQKYFDHYPQEFFYIYDDGRLQTFRR